LTTSAVQADLSSSWKQEVNRRLAEHKSRKGLSAVEQQAPVGAEHHASRRAAEAAARVAARFAKAPSYNEMLASEARAAVRAAEAASRAALDAQAAAESLLAGLEAVSEDNHAWISDAAPITRACRLRHHGRLRSKSRQAAFRNPLGGGHAVCGCRAASHACHAWSGAF